MGSQAGPTILSKLTNKNPRGSNNKTVRLTPETDIEWAANKGQIAKTSITYRNTMQLMPRKQHKDTL